MTTTGTDTDDGATGDVTIDPDERSFYLDTLRGRRIVLATAEPACVDECATVAAELAAAGVDVVVVVPGGDLTPVGPDDLLALWRALAVGSPVTVAHGDVVGAATAFAVGGRMFKLVLVGHDVVPVDAGGLRHSFVDVAAAELDASTAVAAAALSQGVDSVNLAPPGGLAAELFTYEGAGTLLTLGDYGEIRRVGFDDYDAVAALLRRGVDLGYLRPRDDDDLAAVLPRALAFFVAGGSPGGVVALHEAPYRGSGFGELETLYTVNRFRGGGLGRRLVAALDGYARDLGLRHLFAVTTSDEAAAFFVSCGYDEVGADGVPAAKWDAYPPERRSAARCFVHTI